MAKIIFIVEEPSSVDPDKMLRSIGETFATYAFADDTFIEIDGRPKDHFPDLLKKFSQDHDDITITVGAEAFNYRIQSLYGVFN